jgi:AraC family transcriptional regulator, transcriptional activator of pobA
MAATPIFASRRISGHRRTPAVHTNAALSFVTDGKASVEQRSVWSIEPGDVLVVPAGEPHRFIDGRTESWSVGFWASAVSENDRTWVLDPFERVRRGASAVVHLPSPRHAFVERLFIELEQTNDPRAAASLLTLILHEVRGASSSSASPERVATAGVVADSLTFIERHCLGPLTLRDVAEAVGRTPAYVTTAVKRATGKTVGEWIIDGRMAEARRLLLHSGEMVDVIAERVGYADPTHFIRMFRRAHGATPAQWRSARD